jgi:hypothetical protein
MVAAEPSGDFAGHVRQRITQESAAPRPWFSGWVPVTAAALALIVLVTFWMIRRGPAVPELANRKPPTQTARPSREPQVAKEAPLVAAPPHASGPRMIRPPREPQSAAIREPEVLVPPGQMAAVISLYNFVWSGKADGASLVAAAVPTSDLLKPWTTDELKIAPLEIAPLMEEGKPKGSLENR